MSVRSCPLYVSAHIIPFLAVVFYFWPNMEGLGLALGFLLVSLTHEFGHAFLIRRYGLEIYEIQISLAGGYCRHKHPTSQRQAAVIAWGGVLGNLPLLMLTIVLWACGLWPKSPFFDGLFGAWTLLIALEMTYNLLPFSELDGVDGLPLKN